MSLFFLLKPKSYYFLADISADISKKKRQRKKDFKKLVEKALKRRQKDEEDLIIALMELLK